MTVVYFPGEKVCTTKEWDESFRERSVMIGTITRHNFDNSIGSNYFIMWETGPWAGKETNLHSKWFERFHPPTCYIPIFNPRRKLQL